MKTKQDTAKAWTIPFNKPHQVGTEFQYMSQSINQGHISGDGNFTRMCQSFLEAELGTEKVLLTTSCTDALEMTALLLDIQPGDEVIVPSFTFVSTINAFILRGANPVFIDIRPDTLNIDETKIECLVTPKTRAIILVHYAGVACEMDVVINIADQRNIKLIEDNAHGLFGKYKGKFLGTFGELATQSFHETKNFTCGEGGALLINEPQYIERAEILREKGTNRSSFFRGVVDKYTWVDIGSSYLPSDLSAAFLWAQLEDREQIQKKRQEIWEYYNTYLATWAEENNVQLPNVPTYCEQAYHLFYLLMPTLEQRQAFITHLKARGILSVFHYVPLHLSPMGRKFGGRVGQCPITEDISERLVRLPFYNNLSRSEQHTVIKAVKEFTV